MNTAIHTAAPTMSMMRMLPTLSMFRSRFFRPLNSSIEEMTIEPPAASSGTQISSACCELTSSSLDSIASRSIARSVSAR